MKSPVISFICVSANTCAWTPPTYVECNPAVPRSPSLSLSLSSAVMLGPALLLKFAIVSELLTGDVLAGPDPDFSPYYSTTVSTDFHSFSSFFMMVLSFYYYYVKLYYHQFHEVYFLYIKTNLKYYLNEDLILGWSFGISLLISWLSFISFFFNLSVEFLMC